MIKKINLFNFDEETVMWEQYFTSEKHLSDLGMGLCADALKLKTEKDLPEEVKLHLDSCDECRTDVANLVELMDEWGVHPQPVYSVDKGQDALPKKVSWQKALLPWAAILIVGSILGTVYFLKPKDDGGASFQENPELEILVADLYRGGDIQKTFPKINQSVILPLVFRWQLNTGLPVEVRILNNRDETVFSKSTKDDSLLLAKNLPPGLYYWQLSDRNDLLFTGKFRVK